MIHIPQKESSNPYMLMGQSNEKVCEIVIWDDIWSKLRFANRFYNVKIPRLKASIFIEGALDVKPVSLIQYV
jgi:hypothetical protein